MNIPGIRNPVKRRLHLLWIVPYLIVAPLAWALWFAVKGFADVVSEIPSSLRDVWVGRWRR